jgi:hypothetical protein
LEANGRLHPIHTNHHTISDREVNPLHRVSESVRSTHGQDGAVVLDVEQGRIFNVNLVGSRILELLEAGTPESAIADTISREFGVSWDTAIQDMQEFILALKERGLLEETN